MRSEPHHLSAVHTGKSGNPDMTSASTSARLSDGRRQSGGGELQTSPPPRPLVHEHPIVVLQLCTLNINHRRQCCSVSISNRNDLLNTVSLSDWFRPWTPIHEQKHMLAMLSYWPTWITSSVHFLKIILCFMERNVANGNCTLCYFISKVLSLPPLQNTIPARTKQQTLTVPPNNNEVGNCLLQRVTSYVLGSIPNHEEKGHSFLDSVSVMC